MNRVVSIDVLRGLVMVLMALDHTRDYLTNAAFDPLDLTQTSPALFITRWITHFCAPAFIALAGTSAFLSFSRGQSKRELSRFLLTRGLWLVVLELTIVRFGWSFNFDPRSAFAGVIWAIGWSMVALSLLVLLPLRVVGIIGAGVIVLHNLLDPIVPAQFGAFAWLWIALHEGGFIGPFYVLYPILPWVGVMAAGFAFGALVRESENRARLFARWGAGLTLAFLALRALNVYGDPTPWSAQKSALTTFFSFINCWKYPPSLLFVLMTLGPSLLLLAAIEKWPSRAHEPLLTLGRVPLFYYILHIPLIHALTLAIALLRGESTSWMFGNEWLPPQGYGYGLVVVYAVWAFVVVMLYFPCRWYAAVKSRRRSAWMKYL